MSRRFACLLIGFLPLAAFAAPPVSLDDRLTIELVAQNPQLVTPTGVSCDVRGNAWVIESNTHFPPKDYKRHASDQIWVFSGFDERYPVVSQPSTRVGEAASGGAASPTTSPSTQPAIKQTLFADGFQQAMSLLVTPKGRIYITCRNEIVLLEDKDHDLKPDGPAKTLVKLDTKATYPHNGLNGVTLSPDGEYLYFCLGLNAGYDYAVIGSDGSKVAGGQEGGSIWRCTPDGGKVERIAFGFWNCHDLTFDAFGRLFAVDNDPDDIGPCRLLDIIEGGDYGWHFKNGRKGVHPFTSWNGELPGTLPMVAGTGEAPSGILAYESDNLPDDYRGQLLVTSWGDHVIQRFELKEKGASFESKPVDFIRGGEDFRPVGIAQASDGSVFVTDWVDKSYTLHGKGKLWRIRAKTQFTTREPSGSAAGLTPETARDLSNDQLENLLANRRREIRATVADELVRRDFSAVGNEGIDVVDLVVQENPRAAIELVWAASRYARGKEGNYSPTASFARKHSDVAVRAEAIRVLCRMEPLEKADSILLNVLGGNGWIFAPTASGMPYRKALEALDADTSFRVESRLVSKSFGNDPFLHAALISATSRSKRLGALINRVHSQDKAQKEKLLNIDFAIAVRRSIHPDKLDILRDSISSPSIELRRVALQWVGEDRLVQFKDNIVDALKSGDVNRDLLAAYLACKEKLATAPPEPGKLPAEKSGRQFAADFLFDETNDLKLRKIALDLIDPADPKLPAKKLIALIGPMDIDAIKALAWRADEESQATLSIVAGDPKTDIATRREAVTGLARSAITSEATRKTLVDLWRDGPAELRAEALRSLRGTFDRADGSRAVADWRAMAAAATEDAAKAGVQERAEQLLLALKPSHAAITENEVKELSATLSARPKTTADWQKSAAEGGDVENGRRLFSLATGGKCYICHQIGERGGVVGPNLGRVASAMDRSKIVESILEPSKEIAPLYVPVVLELKDGRTISGIPQNEAGAGNVTIADASGQHIRIKADDIESRRFEKLSIMPEGLVDTMTVREFRDLVAYLIQLK